jgi:hypothetical protein
MVGDFIRACLVKIRKEARKNLIEILVKCAPKWAESLLRAANDAANA